MAPPEALHEDTLDKLHVLRQALDDEDHSTVVAQAESLLKERLPVDLEQALRECRRKSWLHLGAYETILDGSDKESLEYQYALYKKEQYAAMQLDVDSSVAARLLQAQVYYKQGQPHKAAALYEDLHDTEDPAGLATNQLAVQIAQASPYVPCDAAAGVDEEEYKDDEDYQANLEMLQALGTRSSYAPWAKALWNGTTCVTETGHKLLDLMNRALATLSPKDALRLCSQPDPSFTPLQKQIWAYNRAVLQLRTNNNKSIDTSLLDSKTAFGLSRSRVLKAYASGGDATLLKDLDSLDPHTQSYLLLHHAHLTHQSAPPLPVASKEPSEVQTALAQGDYAKVVALLEDQDDDPVAHAQWLHALTYTDPDRAVGLSSSSSYQSSLDGATLEQQPLLHHRSSAAATDTNSNKKSRDKILRRRAKQREVHLAHHSGRPPQTWTSKHHHQGGGSSNDNRYDVVARQSQPKASTSTAHLAVSGAGKGRKQRR